MDISMWRARSVVFNQIRAFFHSKNYLEVDTPLLSPDLIPESCLEVFETTYVPPAYSTSRKAQPLWLIPSPEIWMKKLIAEFGADIFQICKCFRNCESIGHLHNPEFTLLEYYTMDADYLDSLTITEEFFAYLLNAQKKGLLDEEFPLIEELKPPFLRITMAEAFERWAGVDLYRSIANGTLAQDAARLGLNPDILNSEESKEYSTPLFSRCDEGYLQSLTIPQLYDLIFVHTVEPQLPKDQPVAIIDYPAFVPCLALKKGVIRERWELYIQGIELANCYSEETDPTEIQAFFEAETREKRNIALISHRIDQEYWRIFREKKHSRYSGVAMGVDRLIMILTGRSTMSSVVGFLSD